MHEVKYDIAIIGGGPSGLAAAIYAGRFDMKTAVIAESVGGAVILTNDIANYPGFKSISGMDLANNIKEHALEYGVEIIEKRADRIERCSQGCFRVFTGEDHVHAKAVIYATGTEWKKLGIPGEKEYTAKGVHYCALCDGAFYKEKVVAVVGGSDSAAKEALLLSDYAKKVYIIYRGDKIRPEPINYRRVIENEKIELIYNTNVVEITGEIMMNRIILDKDYNGSKELKINGLFVDIGHIPLVELAKSIGIEVNQKNEIIIDKDSKTNINGFYAAGDVVDTRFKQAITGVGEGVTAAYSAYHYINENEIICYCLDEEPREN